MHGNSAEKPYQRLISTQIGPETMSLNRDAKKSAFEYIDGHVDEMIDWLCRCIAFKSLGGMRVAGEELEVQKWIRKEFEQWSLFDRIDYWFIDPQEKRPNIVGLLKGKKPDEGKKLIYNGHVDVVPVPDDERPRWKSDPWKGTLGEGRVYGRGAGDMKGGLTAVIWAARAIIESSIELKNDLIVEAVVGEEEGGTGSKAAVRRGYTAPFAVITEPTDYEIKVSTVGNFDFRLTVTGKEIHTGWRNRMLYPQRHGIPTGSEVGVDAIEKAIKFIAAFRELERQWAFRWRHELFDNPLGKTGLGAYTINVTVIRGGNYRGSVAGQCELAGEVYYPSWARGEDVIAEMRATINHVSVMDDWLKSNPPTFEAPDSFHTPAYELDRQHGGCKALARAFTESNEMEPTFAAFEVPGDWNIMGNMGIPVVAFGPDVKGIHGPNESVSIEAVVRVCKTLVAMAIDWCDVL